jgi:hypothetical protein
MLRRPATPNRSPGWRRSTPRSPRPPSPAFRGRRRHWRPTRTSFCPSAGLYRRRPRRDAGGGNGLARPRHPRQPGIMGRRAAGVGGNDRGGGCGARRATRPTPSSPRARPATMPRRRGPWGSASSATSPSARCMRWNGGPVPRRGGGFRRASRQRHAGYPVGRAARALRAPATRCRSSRHRRGGERGAVEQRPEPARFPRAPTARICAAPTRPA